jgi:protein-S-isoprenylcysteine O-methyltransferase Ste14
MFMGLLKSGEGPKIRPRQLATYMLIFVAAPVITFAFGRWLDGVLSLPEFPPFPFNLVFGFTVFFVGLSIGIKSTRLLYREGFGLPWGEARTDVQSRKLVKAGPYAYTRNPMVLGYSLLPLGMGLMFKSPGMAFPTTTAVLLINVVLVKTREEPNLERRFGEEYLEYKRSTPFLIPDTRALLKVIVRPLSRRTEENDESPDKKEQVD